MSYPPGPPEGSPEWRGQQPPEWQGQPPQGWQTPPPQAGWQGQPQPGWQGQREPDNYLVWAILVTVMCCLPFGIVSLISSNKVSGLWAQGRYAEAQAASDSAKKWAIIGAIGVSGGTDSQDEVVSKAGAAVINQLPAGNK